MNQNDEVDEWLATYDTPTKPVVAAVRGAILNGDGRVMEAIKWQSPTSRM